MLQATVSSNLVENPHRIVKLQYFENITRYFRFFQLYPQLTEQAVVSIRQKTYSDLLKMRAKFFSPHLEVPFNK